jgi:CHAT domain-containing protein
MDDPRLTQLPWELLYDDAEPGFVGLSNRTPIVRYMELARGSAVPFSSGPLRLLCMVSSPSDLAPLDVAREREKVTHALAETNQKVEVRWLENATARQLQNALLETDWHVFHYVGHGGFDAESAEGFLALENDQGTSHPLTAAQLATLLADEDTLRLVVLNSCEGAKGSAQSRFSGIAATLTQRGIPAVVAMQRAISDRAAIVFAREFYSAVADGMPVDAAVAEGRKAITIDDVESVEWATPVLYMRSPDGRLFSRAPKPASAPNAAVPKPAAYYDGREDMPEIPGSGKLARIIVPIAILVGLAIYAIYLLR